MQLRTITNLVLAVTLAGLGLFIYQTTRVDPDHAKQRLTNLKPADIDTLHITNVRNEKVVLHKINDQWQLVEPFTARANNGRITKLLNIVGAESKARYNVRDVDLTQLRLVHPDISLLVNQTLLEIGTTESLEQNRYVKLGDTVHLILDRYSFLAQGPATDFVDSQLLADTGNISALHLPDLELKRSDAGWEVSGQAEQPGADHLQQLIDEWQQARAIKITREPTDALSAKIRVEFSGDTPPLALAMTRDDSEIILTRMDSGLAYHFSLSNGEKLLTIPTDATPAR